MIEEFIVKYWLETIFSLVIAILSWCYKQLSKKVKAKWAELEALKEAIIEIKKALKAILHDRLLQSGMFYIERGYIYASELERYNALYVVYHDIFHWNGTGEEIHERVMELEIKKGE